MALETQLQVRLPAGIDAKLREVSMKLGLERSQVARALIMTALQASNNLDDFLTNAVTQAARQTAHKSGLVCGAKSQGRQVRAWRDVTCRRCLKRKPT